MQIFGVVKDVIYQKHDKWLRWCPSREYARGYISLITQSLSSLLSWFFLWLIGNPYMPVIGGSPALLKPPEKRNRMNPGTWPVIVYSHGMASMRTTYSILLTNLASHGYFIAAVEHRDGTAPATKLNKGKQTT